MNDSIDVHFPSVRSPLRAESPSPAEVRPDVLKFEYVVDKIARSARLNAHALMSL